MISISTKNIPLNNFSTYKISCESVLTYTPLLSTSRGRKKKLPLTWSRKVGVGNMGREVDPVKSAPAIP